VFTYAGFDAPKLREILQSQLPTPVPAEPVAPVVGTPTFDANIGLLLTTKCGMCHGAAATAGLNISTYADLMKGGKDGVVVVSGDSANSMIVKVQSEKHFANLSDEELQLLIQWIDAGALEK
jgi:mono/diheme cytochrome c family protein